VTRNADREDPGARVTQLMDVNATHVHGTLDVDLTRGRAHVSRRKSSNSVEESDGSQHSLALFCPPELNNGSGAGVGFVG